MPPQQSWLDSWLEQQTLHAQRYLAARSPASPPAKSQATLDDLRRVPENGKAELVNGELVYIGPTGGIAARASGRIYRALDDYEQQTGRGYAFPDNAGFTVDLPNRRSFSPDAAFHAGPRVC